MLAINKYFLFAILINFVTFSSFATDKYLTSPFKINLEVNSQFAIINQYDPFNKSIKNEYNEFYNKKSFKNKGVLKFSYNGETVKQLKYGAYVKLNTNILEFSSENKCAPNEIQLYVVSNLGILELDNTSSIGTLFDIGSKNTGVMNNKWNDWVKSNLIINNRNRDYTVSDSYISSPNLLVKLDQTNKVAKINYLSPMISNWRFGISFTPDSKSRGAINQMNNLLKNTDRRYQNIWQPAIYYKNNFLNDIKITAILSGGLGKSKEIHYYNNINNLEFMDIKKSLLKGHGLKAWQISTNILWNKISFTSSYGNVNGSSFYRDHLCNSVINNIKNKDQYWSLISSYSTQRYKLSANYIKSKKFVSLLNINNKIPAKFNGKELNIFESFSINANYITKKGLAHYFEITKFNFKDNRNFECTRYEPKFNKGSIFLAGTKINF